AHADDRGARLPALCRAWRRLGQHGDRTARAQPRAIARRGAPHRRPAPAPPPKWQQTDGAYALIQGTRPYSLARGLNDSPAGLASWIVDKFHAWSDCDGDVEQSFTKDELLTNVTLYWVTGTIGSSFLPYADFANAGALTWIKEAFRQWIGSTDVPAAFAMFPKDISNPPREWAARFFNAQRWTETPRRGPL